MSSRVWWKGVEVIRWERTRGLFSEALLALPQGPASTPLTYRMQGALWSRTPPVSGGWRLWSALCWGGWGEYTP